MTPRERLLASLTGQPTDRVPVWLLFPYHATSYYVDVRNHPRYQGIHEASLGRAIVLNRRNLSVPMWEPGVEWSGGKLASDEDLERYLSLPVETDPGRIAAALDRQLPDYLREREEFPLAYGAMMLDLGEPVNPLYHRSVLDEFAVWSLTHAAPIEAWLERVMEQKRLVYRYCLERELADVYFLVGSELAAPPLVRLATFKRWIVPYARELIGMIHDAGKLAIQHFHGQIRDLLPDFVTMAPNGLHTIESPPVGNCTLRQAFEATQRRITLIGNIQYDEFRALDEAAMRRAVREVLREAEGERFILSPTAGPFDPDVPERVIRNYHVFLETACEGSARA